MFGQILKIVPLKENAENILESIFTNLPVTIKNYNEKQNRLFIWLLNLTRDSAIESLNYNTTGKQVENYLLPVNRIKMHAFINELPLFDKAIFSLIYFRSLDIIAIAKLLFLPVKIIKKRFNLLHKF